MTAGHALEFVLIRGLRWLLAPLPLHTLRSVARAVARFVFANTPFRKAITLENLRAAFPDKPEAVRREIARRSYESVAVTLFEFLRWPTFGREDIERMVVVRDAETLHQAWAEGKGVILLTAHHGSWEVFGQMAGILLGPRGTMLFKVQSNPLVADEIDRWRRRLGFRTTAANVGVRDVLSTLSGGGWVVIAGDQSAPKESITVPFFGRDVPTFQGPAAFALRTGAPILLGAAVRRPDDSYELAYERIPSGDLQGDSAENILELTRRHVRATEEMIRRDPDQWMWMHKRWKHLPPPSP